MKIKIIKNRVWNAGVLDLCRFHCILLYEIVMLWMSNVKVY